MEQEKEQPMETEQEISGNAADTREVTGEDGAESETEAFAYGETGTSDWIEKPAEEAESAEETEPAEETESAEEAWKRQCDEMMRKERFSTSFMLRLKDLLKMNLRESLLGWGNSVFWICLIVGVGYLITQWNELSKQKICILICLLVFLIWYVPLLAVRRSVRSAANLKAAGQEIEYHVCDDGIVIATEEMQMPILNSYMRKAKVLKNVIYIFTYRSVGVKFVFPRDILGDDKFEELKKFVKEKGI